VKPGPRLLAALAAVAAIAAAFAGDPAPHDDPSVTAVRLAAWLHDRHDVRIYDVRAQAAFDAFAIPTAEHVTFDSLSALAFARTDTVVVYGEAGDGDAVRAVQELRARDIGTTYVLRGGVDEWVADVLNPTLPVYTTPGQEAEFERVAELSRYFGGVPRRATPTDAPADANAAATPGAAARQLEAVIRRGC
jgi:rhodanese-related sulfurtransferase